MGAQRTFGRISGWAGPVALVVLRGAQELHVEAGTVEVTPIDTVALYERPCLGSRVRGWLSLVEAADGAEEAGIVVECDGGGAREGGGGENYVRGGIQRDVLNIAKEMRMDAGECTRTTTINTH